MGNTAECRCCSAKEGDEEFKAPAAAAAPLDAVEIAAEADSAAGANAGGATPPPLRRRGPGGDGAAAPPAGGDGAPDVAPPAAARAKGRPPTPAAGKAKAKAKPRPKALGPPPGARRPGPDEGGGGAASPPRPRPPRARLDPRSAKLLRVFASEQGDGVAKEDLPLASASVYDGGAFVIDAGETIHIYYSQKSSKDDRRAAKRFADKLLTERDDKAMIALAMGPNAAFFQILQMADALANKEAV